MWRTCMFAHAPRAALSIDFKHFRTCHNHCINAANKKWTKPDGYDTGIKVFNSLTKQKEPLVLAREKIATWYSCGPTVYDHAHLGHACSYVRFDIVQRILTRLFGVTVIHAMVITDVDDKIIRRSREENISPSVLSRMFEDEFKRDMLLLKVVPPTVYLRVTENVQHIVTFIEQIIRNGHAYATSDGDVYFDIQSIGDRYGRFIGAIESQETGSSEKRDPRDFALWKKFKPQEPFWDSPWGRGRPGWHIECSTVASSVFGRQLDIHSGGIDLAFPHHENEIAQSEAYHQCGQWCNYFLHSGHLHLKGRAEKMSKSLKNYITIKDFLKSYSASEFRMFCLLTKYRSGVDYSDGSMQEARASLETVSTFINSAQAYMKGQLLTPPIQEAVLWDKLEQTKVAVSAALADDFDTPRASSALLNLMHHGNCQLQPVSKSAGGPRSPAVVGALVSYIQEVFDMFGIDTFKSTEGQAVERAQNLELIVDQLTRFRSEVRAFALSRQQSSAQPGQPGLYPDRVALLEACDTLRDQLAALGLVIKDRGASSTWEITHRGPRGPQDSQDTPC
ncbi:probable cysteine--tRNA ligase, mitochondrial isoform X1 [Eucyclogobius newberryi]|uniref:probable cysteine--tRNA ligase, mitochondrial isoform X1 n=1 Tax=Eucyclogobius newberryi TaxID=166745 RepID=UPI003B5B1B31